ncbi:MAG: 5-formyltetrahydrofolate cyclo-ligase [Oscillospiraceae bacterium]
MQRIDIRVYKKDIRTQMKVSRAKMTLTSKANKDKMILKNIKNLYQYEDSQLILVYVSTNIEVDTMNIIKIAWKDGKKVAVPRCIDGTREMEFYYLTSFDELETRTFNVLEPKIELCEKVIDFPENSICLIPALAYDKCGYRIGYGGGYYDRFLADYQGLKVGIVYSECVVFKLLYGKYDIQSDIIVTDKYIKTIKFQQ